MTKKIIILIFLFTSCLLPSKAIGNGALFTEGLHGGSVVPIKDEGIQLLEEEVIIDLRSETVKCKFVLFNTNKNNREVLMGFPFRGKYDSYNDDTPIPDDFFKVYVNDESIRTVLRKSDSYNHVYTWPLSISGHERKIIICEYSLILWQSSGDGAQQSSHSFTYITHTGGLWANKIAQAVFKIIYDKKDVCIIRGPTAAFLDNGELVIESSLTPAGYIFNKERAVAEYIFKKWKPTGIENDITFSCKVRHPDMVDFFQYKKYSGDTHIYTNRDLEMPAGMWEITELTSADCIGGGCEEITEEQKNNSLQDLHEIYLKYLRNEIFARRGYKFKDKELQRLFSLFRWYRPIDDFSPNALNATERKNIKKITDTAKNLRKIVITTGSTADRD